MSNRLRSRGPLGLAMAVLMVGMLTGCEVGSFFDPGEVGRFKQKPLMVPILNSLDTGIDEYDARFVNAGDMKAKDLKVVSADYVIGKNDLIQVSITDLVAPGVETAKQTRVSESGFISLPLLGQVKAIGLSESQLEQAIIQGYRDANLIQNAQVSVITIEARNRIFSIYGAVARAGQYALINADTRLLDALVLAGDTTTPVGIDYIYVVRKLEVDPKDDEVHAPADGMAPPKAPSNDALSPQSALPTKPKMMVQDMNPPATAESRIIVVDDKPMQIQGGTPTVITEPPPVAVVDQPAVPASTEPFEFNAPGEPTDVRVIKIPFEALKRGELRYNIVVRAQDFIWVPQAMTGEYYMGGHVQRTGVYSLTARKITIRQAVIAAGGFDQLAWPSRTEIVRRIGTDKQVFARVDLAKIFSGEEPDILLKPDDQVSVGTNFIAPFLASFRSGFRLTYGFGFIYDRNYWEANNQ